jgi:hypothetical protein
VAGAHQEVTVVNITLADLQVHRVTIEWFLDRQPDAEWIEAFDDTVLNKRVMRAFVPSAYGRPMVMHDATIVWAVRIGDVRCSLALVEKSVVYANAGVRGTLVPFRSSRGRESSGQARG